MRILEFIILTKFPYSCNSESEINNRFGLEPKLSGKWNTEAFDEELHEWRELSDNGWKCFDVF
ncbi:MAG: hypothetical protein HKN00_08875 [Flavobacteriaceae bacterium]|nr:hypothetical protein [Bacteroidia bacterium]NNF75282.1 hypothetical protein [Flavobacteriaceae bacterium]NNK72111.1 hypothetical protein [Flavobacteriaceae bacterium]